MENPTLPGVDARVKAEPLLPAKGAVNTAAAISLLPHSLYLGAAQPLSPLGTGWSRRCVGVRSASLRRRFWKPLHQGSGEGTGRW